MVQKNNINYIFILLISTILMSFSTYGINITACGSQSTGNAYYDFTGDLITNTTLCLNMGATANNITIDGHGYRLIGNYSIGSSYGIFFSNGGYNATVKNLTIIGFDYPIYTSTYANISADNISISTIGKVFVSGNLNLVYNNLKVYNTTFGTYTAIVTPYFLNNILITNSIWNNSYAFTISNSTNITIINSTRVGGTSGLVFTNIVTLNINNNVNLDYMSTSNAINLNISNNLWEAYNGSRYIYSNTDFNTQKLRNIIFNNNIVYADYNGSNVQLSFYDLIDGDISNNQFGSLTRPINVTGATTFLTVWSATNLTEINNTLYFYNNTNALYLRGNILFNSSNILIDSNKVYFANDANKYALTCGNDDSVHPGKDVYIIRNCTVSNNLVKSAYGTAGKHMIMLKHVDGGSVYNNNVTNGGYNFVIKDNNHLDFYNNRMTNGTSGTLHVKGTSNSLFHNNFWDSNTNGVPIFIWWDNLANQSGLNNTFYDMDMSNIQTCPQISVATNANTSQKFINVTLTNNSCLNVANGSTSGVNSVSFGWWLNISFNKVGNLNIADGLGSQTNYPNILSLRTDLTDYTVTDGVYTYFNNYTLTETYYTEIQSQNYNLTNSKNIEDNIVFTLVNLPLSEVSPVSYSLSTNVLAILIIIVMILMMGLPVYLNYENWTLNDWFKWIIVSLIVLIFGLIIVNNIFSI